MSKKQELTPQQIAAKIREGNDFIVRTNSERKRVLTAAQYLGAGVITRAIKGGGFRVIIPSEVEN